MKVALLTGGQDKPYALGLGSALVSQGIFLDFIGSDDLVFAQQPGNTLESSELPGATRVTFLNLRGDQSPDASLAKKVARILIYYGRLIRYAATAKPKIFHILWNNKFQLFDRTALMLYYRALGKRIALTVHNVNAGKRDANDNLLNHLTLKIQYQLADHIFVHTDRMRNDLVNEFGVSKNKITVIPFGLNNTVPNTKRTAEEARRLLGVRSTDKTILFFGRIAPYKGVEYLIAAFADALGTDRNYRLIIAGSVKYCPDYWRLVQDEISRRGVGERIIERIEFIPDEETEVYFKAADVLVLPYTHIFQSGVLVLAYNFGLPVIASDVGSLREDIVEGKTGYIFRPTDSADMARTIRKYFESDLYRQLELRRRDIREYAHQRFSWATVGEITRDVYANLCKR